MAEGGNGYPKNSHSQDSQDEKNILHLKNYFELSKITYKERDVITCLESFSIQNISEKDKSDKKLLHLVFIGDSRIRQIFYSFLKVCA